MYSLHLFCLVGLFLVTVCSAASECNDVGSRNADGKCDCEPNFYGENCECNSVYGLPLEACISVNGTGIPCSGRGICRCGFCECSRRHGQQYYAGTYCECDDYSCDYHNSIICGGNGQCKCGECVCNEGFFGNACESHSDHCMYQRNQQICNNAGRCVQGVCQCVDDFRGPQCQYCPTCPGECAYNKECAICIANFHLDTTVDRECSEVCGTTKADIVDSLDTAKENLCQYITSTDNVLRFTYTSDKDDKVQIKVLRYATSTTDSTNDDQSSASCPTTFSYFLSLFVLVSTAFLF